MLATATESFFARKFPAYADSRLEAALDYPTRPAVSSDEGDRVVARLASRAFSEIIDPCLAAASAEEFLANAAARLPEFRDIHIAIVEAMAVWTPERGAAGEDRVLHELMEFSESLMGDSAPDEIDFCVQTARRASRIAARMTRTPVRAELEQVDAGCAHAYTVSAILHVFAMVCLMRIQDASRRPALGIIEAIFTVLREGALNAYRAAREGERLRATTSEDAQSSDHDWMAFEAAGLDCIDSDA